MVSYTFITLLCIFTVISVTPGSTEDYWNHADIHSSTCGVRNSDSSHPVQYGRDYSSLIFKIAGGTESAPYTWPWMAVLEGRKDTGEFKFLCGASIISAQFLLTAGHCFYFLDKGFSDNPNDFQVRTGAHHVEQGTVYQVIGVKIHENFRFHAYYNDIALLQVAGNMLINGIRPVCLPENPHVDDNFMGEPVMVTGWGKMEEGGPSSIYLNEVMITITPREECDVSYRQHTNLNFIYGIIDKQLCAGIPEAGKDACSGDSGGPLIKEFTPNVWTVVGVVSLGASCAHRNVPGLYTRISQYLDWIRSNTA